MSGMGEQSASNLPRHLSLGVCLTALAVLLFEITLTRIFSYTIWYHFAYLTISVALLGFGAAGSVLAAFPRLLAKNPFRLLSFSAFCASSAALAALTLLAHLQLDPMRILQERGQLLTLVGYCLAVTVPFFFAGLCISGALTIASKAVSRLYFWDLLGAGLGCSVAVVSIWWLGTPGAALAAALCFAGGGLAFGWRQRLPGWRIASMAALSVVAAAIGGLGWLDFQPNGSKFLAMFMATPGAKHVFSQWTPINRVDFVKLASPEGSYVRDGISTKFDGNRPHFGMVSYDGDSCAVMYDFSGDLREMGLFRYHVLRAPYVLLERPSVLMIGLGGGADILNGLVNGAGSMVGVEINPVTVDIGKGLLADFNGGIFNRENVRIVPAEGRNFLRSHSRNYDLIEINGVDTLSALTTGAYVLSESYLYTTDAVNEYLDHLEPGGLFAMAMGDFHTHEEPARHSLRLASVVRRALLNRGVTQPQRHVMIVASTQKIALTHTLVKNEPFSSSEVAAVDRFAQEMGFAIWQRPDRPVKEKPHSVIFWGPDQERESLYSSSHLNLRETTDESPFFFNFYKWRALLGERVFAPRRTTATGQIVLVLMLIQAIVFSAILILGPIARLRPALASVPRVGGYLFYFASLGLGFILIEISFIQRFSLFLGYPTYSLTVILFSLLLFTGVGSYRTENVADRQTAIKRLLAKLTVVVVLYLFFLPAVFRLLLGTPLWLRIGVTIAMMLPLGLLMGGFFPHGVRIVRELHPSLVPWGWATNGCATVIGTVLAVIIGITWSFRVATVVAVVSYCAGVGALLWALAPELATKKAPSSS